MNFGGLGKFGSALKGGLSTGMDKLKTIGKSGNRIIQPTDLDTGGFSGKVFQQADLDASPDSFSGSVIQQKDLDNPAKLTFKDKWNAIPQEKKSAFAEQMSKNAEDGAQVAQMSLPQMHDYSWALQPTRGSMFYGN